MNRQINGRTGKWKVGRMAERQTDRQTDRETDRQNPYKDV